MQEHEKLGSPQSPWVGTGGTGDMEDQSYYYEDQQPEQPSSPAKKPAQPKPAMTGLRIASYNIRVDHTDDIDTIHEWPLRQDLVAASIVGLAADVIAVQAISPVQAVDLTAMLGADWAVSVMPCDPDAWATTSKGPAGDYRNGNGVVYRKSRVELIDMKMFWLSPRPDAPWQVASPPWNGSGIQRACAQCTFLDLSSGLKLAVLSTQFDNDADDAIDTGGSEARRSSAALVMDRASQLKRDGHAELVIVCGDFNTFEDRNGATYSALVNAADGALLDARDCPSVMEMDGGRGSATWEGWEDHPHRRSAAGDMRYDQMFVSADATVTRTTVGEGRFAVLWGEDYHWVYASDHLPVVTDLLVPVNAWAKKRRQRLVNCCDKLKQAKSTMTCVIILGVLAAILAIVMIYLIWDWISLSYECRLQCRIRTIDPPFCQNEAAERMLLEWQHD